MNDTLVINNGEMEFLQSPSIAKLMPALLDAVADFDPLLKDATNPAFRSKYASLSGVFNAVRPALDKHRLLQTQQTTFDQYTGKNIVITRVIHESGEWIAARWLLTPAKNDPQGEGSALTYARRYTLTSLLGIAAEDDDANAASNTPRQQAPRQQAPRVPTVPPARPTGEPSGRPWLAEATELVAKKGKTFTPLKRRELLLALMEECRGFGELDADLLAKFVELGNGLKAEAAAAAA